MKDADRYPGRHSTGCLLKLSVNGEIREMPEGVTVRALLEAMELGRDRVAVEVNAEVVRRALHSECVLAEGDRVEIVTFVGGG
jgi:sulfur carrier protein